MKKKMRLSKWKSEEGCFSFIKTLIIMCIFTLCPYRVYINCKYAICFIRNACLDYPGGNVTIPFNDVRAILFKCVRWG